MNHAMKRKLYTALLPILAATLPPMLACALLTACANETLPAANAEEAANPTTLTATLPDDTDTGHTPGNNPDTRLSHESESSATTPGVIVRWTAGDAFKLYPVRGTSGGIEYKINNPSSISGDGKTATFIATTTPSTPITGEAKAIYPAAAALQMDGKTPATSWRDIPLSMDGQTQTGDDSYAHTPAYDYMVADVADATSLPTNNDLTFHHLAAMMTVKITGQPSGYTPVTSPDAADNSPVQLTLSVNGKGANFYSEMPIDNGLPTYGSASLRLEGITWDTNGFTAHLMIFPVDLSSKTFTLSVLCKDGTTYRYSTPEIGKKYVAGMRYTATIAGDDWTKSTTTKILSTSTTPAENFASGTGDSDDPFLISTAEELLLMQKKVNDGSYNDYRLTTDIEIADDVTWVPIGTYDNRFQGSFDGGGHTISGTLRGNNQHFGFFGYVDGNIRNLRIAATVTNSYEASSTCYTGGVAGFFTADNEHTLYRCSYKGSVTGGKTKGTSTSNENCTGGLVGVCQNTILSGCTVEAGSKVTGGSTTSSDSYTGGLVGYVISNTLFESCTNYADIEGAQSKNSYTGGLVGYAAISGGNSSNINNCRNRGAVTGGTAIFYSRTGGLVGNNYGNNTITNCTNEGTVTGGTAQDCYTGGLVGTNNSGTLHTSHNTSTATVTAGRVTNVSNTHNFTGGLVGQNTTNGKVYSCCTNAATVANKAPDASGTGTDNRIGGENKTVIDCD